MLGGVPPSSLSSGQLDAQVAVLAASAIAFLWLLRVLCCKVSPVLLCLHLFLPLPRHYPNSQHPRLSLLLGLSLTLGSVSLLDQMPMLHQPFMVGPGLSPIGLFQKKVHIPPDGWGHFLTPPPPLSPGFPEAQDPHSCLDFQDKRPPSCLDFRKKKLLGLNLI